MEENSRKGKKNKEIAAYLQQNAEFLSTVLEKFIQDEMNKYGFTKAVIALSGGLDSTLVSYIAAKALNPDQLLLLYMPYGKGLSNDDHANMVSKDLGLHLETWNIKNTADSLCGERSIKNPLRKGNVFARLRMVNLFDVSAREKALVIGTSNKTELLIGYSTWYGDSAAGILPLGDIYKTQAFALADYFRVPEEIINKPPSAELWETQTDEEEIGLTYDELDQILFWHIDKRFTFQELVEKGFSKEHVTSVLKLCRKSLYKQRLPIIPKVSSRTIGLDYRLIKEATNAP
ncbi:MAG: NAD+ synthase [Caldisericia bacterium]|nr:NAD+ synthase [Caldisericia bacterium]